MTINYRFFSNSIPLSERTVRTELKTSWSIFPASE